MSVANDTVSSLQGMAMEWRCILKQAAPVKINGEEGGGGGIYRKGDDKKDLCHNNNSTCHCVK